MFSLISFPNLVFLEIAICSIHGQDNARVFSEDFGANTKSTRPLLYQISGDHVTHQRCAASCLGDNRCGGVNYVAGLKECGLVDGLTSTTDIELTPDSTFFAKQVTSILGDECSWLPCLNGGTCIGAISGYTCTCPPLYTGTRCETCAVNCDILQDHFGVVSDGVHTISVAEVDTPVYCDMTTDGGGWTVMLRREDGSVDFDVPWSDYKVGFGSSSGEHWLGNEIVHQMTAATPYDLRIDLTYGNDAVDAVYAGFTVGAEATDYTLTLSSFVGGTAGDSLLQNNLMKFSTSDRENDVAFPPDWHCAVILQGGWWFSNCGYEGQLTGLYGPSPPPYFLSGTPILTGIMWFTWAGDFTTHPEAAEMKIRPQ